MTARLSFALLLHLFAFQPLQAAVMGVPFVDPLTTERDTTLPLTVGEWEEWGAPLHPTACLNVIVPLPVAGCPLERQTVHCFWSTAGGIFCTAFHKRHISLQVTRSTTRPCTST